MNADELRKNLKIGRTCKTCPRYDGSECIGHLQWLCNGIKKTEKAEARESGRWEQKEVYDCKGRFEQFQHARCSVCGKYHTTPYVYYFDDFKFCPNCGADMRERSEE